MPEDRINARQAWVAARVSIVTEMSHGQIVASDAFRASVKAHSFFSARVAETRVIERIRRVSDQYTLGQIDRTTARDQLKTFLRARGYQPDGAITDDEDTDRSMGNLASTARLNLILNQNKLMADAVGKRSEILRLGVPYQRYVPSWKTNRRDSHTRYYDLVLPSTDPFWATHTPPLEFNCGCSIEPVWDDAEAREFGGVANAAQDPDGNWTVTAPDGTRIPVPPSQSGYEFDSSAPFQLNDLGRLHEPYRERVVKGLEDVVSGHGQKVTFVAPAPEGEAVAVDLPGLDGLDAALKPGVAQARELAVQAGFDPDVMPDPKDFEATNAAFEAAGIDLRNPPPALMNAVPAAGRKLGEMGPATLRRLGLPGNRVAVVLTPGSKKFGIKHCWYHHKEVFFSAAETSEIIQATVGNPDAMLALTLIPVKGGAVSRRIVSFDREAQAICVMQLRSATRAELMSWHRASEDYSDRQQLLSSLDDAAAGIAEDAQ